MRQPHHAGRYRIDELKPPTELLTEGESEEVKGGSEGSYFSTAASLYGPLAPLPVLVTESSPAARED